MRILRLVPVLAATALLAACGTATAPTGEDAEAATSSKKKKAPQAATIGSTVKDGKFTFKVTKIANGPKRIGNEFAGTRPQGKFVYVHVTVKNHGDEAQYFSGDAQKLLAGDKEYSADSEAAVYLGDSQSLFEEINPGNAVKGIIVYDIPKTVKPTGVELHDSPFSRGVRIVLK